MVLYIGGNRLRLTAPSWSYCSMHSLYEFYRMSLRIRMQVLKLFLVSPIKKFITDRSKTFKNTSKRHSIHTCINVCNQCLLICWTWKQFSWILFQCFVCFESGKVLWPLDLISTSRIPRLWKELTTIHIFHNQNENVAPTYT